MRYTILFVSISLLFISCGKSKFTTAPQLTVKSINTKDLFPDDVLQIKLSFTDKEGDLDGTIYVQQYSINCAQTKFESHEKLPTFPTTSNTEGEIVITYGYRVPPTLVEPQCTNVKLDTCFFRFVLTDKAKNNSDTVQTDFVVLHKL